MTNEYSFLFLVSKDTKKSVHDVNLIDMFACLVKHLSSTIRHYRLSSRLFSTKYSYRKNLVSDLSNINLIDQSVSLHGWLQYRRMNSFGVLRDHSGLIQFILPSSMKDERQIFKETPVESCLNNKVI
jgi:hypothetical protein